jgi:hypothetical protein
MDTSYAPTVTVSTSTVVQDWRCSKSRTNQPHNLTPCYLQLILMLSSHLRLWIPAEIKILYIFLCCRRYTISLQAERSGDRAPVGVRFFALVQTGPGDHPASCTMDTGSFPGVKRQGHGVNHQPPPSAEVKETVQLYFYYPCAPSWPVLGWTLPIPHLSHARYTPCPSHPNNTCCIKQIVKLLIADSVFFTSSPNSKPASAGTSRQHLRSSEKTTNSLRCTTFPSFPPPQGTNIPHRTTTAHVTTGP